MTRLPGDAMPKMTYSLLIHERQYREIYARMRAERLLWAAWPDMAEAEWTAEEFCRRLGREEMYVLGGYIDDEPAGVLLLWPVAGRSLCAEVGLTAFRRHFRQARELARGALLHASGELSLSAIIGRVAAPNRHILRLLGSLGFAELGRVPGMIWYAAREHFVDGVLVMATPESIHNSREA